MSKFIAYTVAGSMSIAMSAVVQPVTTHDLFGGTFDKVLNIGLYYENCVSAMISKHRCCCFYG